MECSVVAGRLPLEGGFCPDLQSFVARKIRHGQEKPMSSPSGKNLKRLVNHLRRIQEVPSQGFHFGLGCGGACDPIVKTQPNPGVFFPDEGQAPPADQVVDDPFLAVLDVAVVPPKLDVIHPNRRSIVGRGDAVGHDQSPPALQNPADLVQHPLKIGEVVRRHPAGDQLCRS